MTKRVFAVGEILQARPVVLANTGATVLKFRKFRIESFFFEFSKKTES